MNNENDFSNPFHLIGMITAICEMPGISSDEKVHMIYKATTEFIEYHKRKD